MAKAWAVRVRFPAWSASVRSRHLPICLCLNGNQTASVICAPSLRGLADIPVVQLRKNARIQSGRRGFDSHRERQFRRAVEFGLSVKRATASGFKSRPSRQMAGFPTRLSSVINQGRAAVLRLSNW